jgi:outer membrane protein assembly factor BamA
MSIAGGYNFQLTSESKTYPDRLFFLGGVDSIRAFLADQMVPEDVAQRILHNQLTIDQVAIRGGNLALNPRVELRVPITDLFAAGFFLDTGNLWVDPSAIDLLALRVALGAGLRIATPIGPIALDYGINMLRRPWEDFGAFHFSIGLF